jgi:hypothetical protein
MYWMISTGSPIKARTTSLCACAGFTLVAISAYIETVVRCLAVLHDTGLDSRGRVCMHALWSVWSPSVHVYQLNLSITQPISERW